MILATVSEASLRLSPTSTSFKSSRIPTSPSFARPAACEVLRQGSSSRLLRCGALVPGDLIFSERSSLSVCLSVCLYVFLFLCVYICIDIYTNRYTYTYVFATFNQSWATFGHNSFFLLATWLSRQLPSKMQVPQYKHQKVRVSF